MSGVLRFSDEEGGVCEIQLSEWQLFHQTTVKLDFLFAMGEK